MKDTPAIGHGAAYVRGRRSMRRSWNPVELAVALDFLLFRLRLRPCGGCYCPE